MSGVGECPTGKVRYQNRTAAVTVMRGVRRSRGRWIHKDHIPTRVYRCAECADGWHITSGTDTDRARTRRQRRRKDEQ